MAKPILQNLLDAQGQLVLDYLNSKKISALVTEYAALCNPSSIKIIANSEDDRAYIKKRAMDLGEEIPMIMPGHSAHFDGPTDLARDKAKTKVLTDDPSRLSHHVNSGDRKHCLAEMRQLLKNSMAGKQMLVGFFCLGPLNSPFTLYAMQITDSPYVIHSETLLFREGFESFKSARPQNFFYFIHASGRTKNAISQDTEKKRVYIDLAEDRVFAVNTQYAGSSVGLKKLAFRLTINQAAKEGWLSEHMFIMGAKSLGKNRTTYFTGAFPSSSGKTTTAMIPGQSIVGDDLAFLRVGSKGECRAANAEIGIFGVLENVSPKDDPLIYKTLTTPRELIFSNVLVNQGKPYWLGMGQNFPDSGINFHGAWHKGLKDSDGQELAPTNKNARYTLRLAELENLDPNYNDPSGVEISGIMYGGRDPDGFPPVLESFNWNHGVFLGASIETETTSATVGEIGAKKHDPMANIDFLSIPLGEYLANHFAFGAKLKRPPKIFATNYFLKEAGQFINKKPDIKVWLMWMEGRVHGEFQALASPLGFLPLYQDLKNLFTEIFNKHFERENYEKQFSLRTAQLLQRLERVEAALKPVPDLPDKFKAEFSVQKQRLLKARQFYGQDIIPPSLFLQKLYTDTI